MNDIKLLVGSLSNDLFRVATLAQRESVEGAERFMIEAKRWASQLDCATMPNHISEIVNDINGMQQSPIPLDTAEKLLMYGVLLENYSLHL